jgi:hypothetical protein
MQASKISVNDVDYAVKLKRAQGVTEPEIIRARVVRIVSTRTNNGAPNSLVYVRRCQGSTSLVGDEIVVEPDQVLDEAKKYAELMAQQRSEMEERNRKTKEDRELRERVAAKLARLGVAAEVSYDSVRINMPDMEAAEKALDALLPSS